MGLTSTSVLAAVTLVAGSAAAVADPAPTTALCRIGGPSGNVQMAYKPHGSPVFGSDGLTCRNPWKDEAARSAAKAAAAANPGPVPRKQASPSPRR